MVLTYTSIIAGIGISGISTYLYIPGIYRVYTVPGINVQVYSGNNPVDFGPRFSHRSDRFDRSASSRPVRNVMDRTMALREKNRYFLPE